MNFAALIFLFLFASQTFASFEIIGGTKVEMSDPLALSTVRIHAQIARASMTCSGVLISQDTVLTAAHCLGPGWAVIKIYFADGSGPIELREQQWSDKYTPLAGPGLPRNDIAILKLKTPAPTKFVPVKMSESPIAIGQTLVLAGYGQTDSSLGKTNGLGALRKISQKILEPNYNPVEFLVDIRGGGPCFGDSGGPAYSQSLQGLEIVGITSRLSPNDLIPGKSGDYECKNDIIYTNVSAEISWIRSQM